MLTRVADELRNHARRTDFYAPIGGGEFLGLLPGTTYQEAEMVADILATNIAQVVRPLIESAVPIGS